MSIIFSGCPFSSLLMARVVKSLILEGPKSFLSMEGGKVGRGQLSAEGEHTTRSDRVRSSDVKLRSTSGDDCCVGNWSKSVSSRNLCAKEKHERCSKNIQRIFVEHEKTMKLKLKTYPRISVPFNN